jgi:hypothetical protein
MSLARFGHGMIQLPDGRVLVAGGMGYNPTQSSDAAALKSTEIWDPETGIFTPGPEMQEARAFPVLVYLAAQNAVYAAGGASTSTEYLDLGTMRWERSTASLSATREYSIGVAMDGYVLMTGGMNGTVASNTNFLLLPASERILAGGLNALLKVTALPGGSKVRVKSVNHQDYTKGTGLTGEVVLVTAGAGAAYKGPFILNPTQGPAVTATEATLDMDIAENTSYSTLTLQSGQASLFPDTEGFLVVSFGTADETFPVPYLGRFTADALALDSDYVFPRKIDKGAKVTLLSTKGAWTPASPETIGAFYLTASNSGRVSALQTIRDIVAAGVDVNTTIVYPSDRGLGAEGFAQKSDQKLSDIVTVYGSDDLDDEIDDLRDE